MKILFVYPRFQRHAEANPELLKYVPMNEYLGSPSLGIASMAAVTPPGWEIEFRDDRLTAADTPTDADLVALSFFTAAASRGMALADHFRAAGHTVVAGGIFPTMMPDIVAPHVDAVVIGEGEPVWPKLLADVQSGALKARYVAEGPVDLSTVPVPDLSLYFGVEGQSFRPDDYPLQISRGCKLNCHACALPVSMTTNMRNFPLEQIIGQLEQLDRAGKLGCLTEDTSWFPGTPGRRLLGKLFDYVIDSGRRVGVSYAGISMPMIITTPTSFLKKAKAAGVDMFYLVGGFDPITMKAFTGKDPRALDRAYTAVAKAWDAGIEPYTSFLLGGDNDDLGTVDRMLEFAEKANIRKAEFAIATPYPGTPQWHQLVAEDRILTRDWSRYNDANVVFQPKHMTPDELHNGYLRLWREFYASRGHLRALSQYERTIQF